MEAAIGLIPLQTAIKVPKHLSAPGTVGGWRPLQNGGGAAEEAVGGRVAAAAAAGGQ